MIHSTTPVFYSGQRHVDDRGSLAFNNPFQISQFVRGYVIENSSLAPMRGWHGHKLESKGFLCLSGRVRVGAVEIDDWDSPSKELEVYSQELTAGAMDCYFVPSGYANAILSLEINSKVLVFSSSTLEASMADDFRFPLSTWRL